MKADLALSLSVEGISLLGRNRHAQGWRVIKTISLDMPRLSQGLSDLKSLAEEECGPDYTTLLILPNDQLLYMTVPLAGRDPHTAAAGALDGATPYKLSELVFDTAPTDRDNLNIHIAVVAKDTLQEAESFAEIHGFQSVAFTAMPDAGHYNTAPFFGLTKKAQTYLKGAQFTPEDDPIEISDDNAASVITHLTEPQKVTSYAAYEEAISSERLSPYGATTRAQDPRTLPRQKNLDRRLFQARAVVASSVIFLSLATGLGAWFFSSAPHRNQNSATPEVSQITDIEDISIDVPVTNAANLLPTSDTPLDSGMALTTVPVLTDVTEPSTILPSASVVSPTPMQANLRQNPSLKLPTPQEVLHIFETDGVWIGRPDAPLSLTSDSITTIHITTLDHKVHNNDPIALEPAALLLSDTPPIRVTLPLALNLESDVALNTLYSPPLVDPPPPAEDTLNVSEDIVQGEGITDVSEEAIPIDLSLIQPKARPENFRDTVERSQWNGFTLTELRSIRPQKRPRSAQELAAEAARLASQASLSQSEADPTNSPLVVAKSLRPIQRPANFSETVAAATAQTQEPQRTSAAVTPSIQPSSPSPRSVAEAATERNALVLNRLALIGTFGKTAAPAAMVRMSSGRVRRVEVGDRLDGGRVVAIGQGRLVYRKGSRDITLQMPRI